MHKNYSSPEILESRIAPAAVYHFTDIDGDQVTISTSHGTNAQLATAVHLVSAGALGGYLLTELDLSSQPAIFNGTDLTITAHRGPLGGDGLTTLDDLHATGLDLGNVSVQGTLVALEAGKNAINSHVGSITAQGSGQGVWNLEANVGSIHLLGDLRQTDVEVAIGSLGSLVVGGSLIGDGSVNSGSVHVAAGHIGSVQIGGDLEGAGPGSAMLSAQRIGPVFIAGSMQGGYGDSSGSIQAAQLGSIHLGGNLQGGSGIASGAIVSPGRIGDVFIGGSVIGGSNYRAGSVGAADTLGNVFVGHDVRGGGAHNTGDISSVHKIGNITIGGSLIGGLSDFSGRIICTDDNPSDGFTSNIGAIHIGGDLAGGSFYQSGAIYAGGQAAFSGFIHSLSVGGSVIGDGAGPKGQVYAAMSIGDVHLGGDLRGGSGQGSGEIQTSNLGHLSVGGDIAGGSGVESGSVTTSAVPTSSSAARSAAAARAWPGNSVLTVRSGRLSSGMISTEEACRIPAI